MLGIASRTKYYAAWSLTEGSCIMAGIAYNGIDEKTGKAKWGESVRCKRIPRVPFSKVMFFGENEKSPPFVIEVY